MIGVVHLFPIYPAYPSINEVISKNSKQNRFDLINSKETYNLTKRFYLDPGVLLSFSNAQKGYFGKPRIKAEI